MKTGTRIQLSLMMFLQFFIWGAWYVVMGTYLFKIGFDGLNIGAAFSTVNWGAILSPFIIGVIADRFLPSENDGYIAPWWRCSTWASSCMASVMTSSSSRARFRSTMRRPKQ